MTTRTNETGLFERLVLRGRRVEKEGAGRVRSVTDGVRAQIAERFASVEDTIEERVRGALEHSRVPTRDELDRLTRRIDDLAEIVETLEAEATSPQPAAERTYHVTPHSEGGWKVEAEDASRATSVHRTKAEAVRAARGVAGRHAPSRLVIHRADGTIQEHRSYD